VPGGVESEFDPLRFARSGDDQVDLVVYTGHLSGLLPGLTVATRGRPV